MRGVREAVSYTDNVTGSCKMCNKYNLYAAYNVSETVN